MDLGLRDKICVVTGSTAGIGFATARLLAAEGAQVVISGRDAGRVERARQEAGAALGVACDLTEPGASDALVSQTVAKLGGLDCLVNNVGVAYQRPFDALSDDDWDRQWQANVMSCVRATRAAIPHMRERGRGAIVNVSSSAGKRPSTSMPDYSVMKAAQLSLSRLIADLYSSEGIRCNAVTPADGDGGLARRRRARRPARGSDRPDPRRSARRGCEGAASGPHGRAGRDRRGDRLLVLRAVLVRDRGSLERRRRHCRDHRLSAPRGALRSPSLAVSVG